MLRFIKEFLSRDDGPTAVEYAVLLALIVIACVGAATGMANATADSFENSADQLATVFGS
ncbi:Flp family type IVb pilin [Aeoliella mucimassa]|uniref:Flp/Fap pilin component n=1 Tax=Aeoliella mucimassa TaxID=2527972 RepID=A0A518ARH6_9BACT|nr:Flp family type IVb pilin [Aeoliella mucimassa]QDU57329.1 hypothetical protein Pan181_35440 [Aeoliella mucimassa]